MNIETVNQKLDEKIPRDAVSTRKGGGASALSYLETHYVIDRMNAVFGNLGWSSETTEMKQVSDTDKPTYIAKVRICVHNPVTGTPVVIKEGYGYGSDKNTLNPHEMAIKEAESDAFKRAAKNLGQSMGLALYDKTQENVEDGKNNQPVVRTVQTAQVRQVPAASVRDTDADINEVITSTSRAIIAKKKATVNELFEMLKSDFGVTDKAELDTAGKQKLVTKLQSMLA